MEKRKTGVFGSMKDDDERTSDFKYISPVEESDPDTIYKVLFEEYDEENLS